MLDQPRMKPAVTAGLPENNSIYALDQENSAHLMRVLRGLYSKPEFSVARELICNALDACKSVGKDGSGIHITFGDKDKPAFDIRDYATGLTPDEAAKTIFSFGGSESRFSKTAIGNKGLGAKSPFCLSDQFTVTSRCHGMKHVWLCYIDEDDCCQRNLVSSGPSDEPSGLQVTVPLKDVGSMRKQIRDLLAHFPAKDRPVIEGINPESLETPEPEIMHGTLKITSMGDQESVVRWELTESNATTEYKCFLVTLGPVAYDVSYEEAMPELAKSSDYWELRELLARIRLRAPVDFLPLAPSREDIAYTGRCKRVLAGVLNSLLKTIIPEFLKSNDTLEKEFEKHGAYNLLRFVRTYRACFAGMFSKVDGTSLKSSNAKVLAAFLNKAVFSKVKLLKFDPELLTTSLDVEGLGPSHAYRCVVTAKSRARYGTRSYYIYTSALNLEDKDTERLIPSNVILLDYEPDSGNRVELVRKAVTLEGSLPYDLARYTTSKFIDVVFLGKDAKVPNPADIGWTPPWKYYDRAKLSEVKFEEQDFVAPAPPVSVSSSAPPPPRTKYNNVGGMLLEFLPLGKEYHGYGHQDHAYSKLFASCKIRSVTPGSTIAVGVIGGGCHRTSVAKGVETYTTGMPGILQLFKVLKPDVRLYGVRSSSKDTIEAVFKVQTYKDLLEEQIKEHAITEDELEAALGVSMYLEFLPSVGGSFGANGDKGYSRLGWIGAWAHTTPDASDSVSLELDKPYQMLAEEAERLKILPERMRLVRLWMDTSKKRKRLIMAAFSLRLLVGGAGLGEPTPDKGCVHEVLSRLIETSSTACFYALLCKDKWGGDVELRISGGNAGSGRRSLAVCKHLDRITSDGIKKEIDSEAAR